MKCLDGIMRTVLITGASRGLGKAIANLLAYNNYKLILCCNKTDIQEAENIDVIKGDLKEEKTLIKITEKVKEKGGVDVFINNAGQYLNKPFVEVSVEEIKRIINVNLLAPMLLTKLLWPLFKNYGLMININSLAGKTGSQNETIYSASKQGLKGFTEALQFDATKTNIKIIDLFLGTVDTDMANMTKNKKDKQNFIKPINVASLILKLCEDYPSLRIIELTICRANY
jgi:3-oxoacyl-[acyl-carrier protein] reductase